jgi:hypothetical protein
MGDTQFHFRTRLCSSGKQHDLNSTHDQYNRQSLLAHQIDLDCLYGYVYFRQVRDRSARRGYFQKSLVFLSRFPFVNLFYETVACVAPQFFEHGADILKRACRDIDHWPAPLPGNLSLTILTTTIRIKITHRTDKAIGGNSSPTRRPIVTSASSGSLDQKDDEVSLINVESAENISPAQHPRLIPSIYTLNVYKHLLPVISHVQLLWELVLTCEPLIVMASTPDVCSQVVSSLVSIITPLKYSRDYRPFFTIHDSEFKEYTSKKQSP